MEYTIFLDELIKTDNLDAFVSIQDGDPDNHDYQAYMKKMPRELRLMLTAINEETGQEEFGYDLLQFIKMKAREEEAIRLHNELKAKSEDIEAKRKMVKI